MRNQNKYPIPENIDPDTDFCAKVYIPDSPDYRRVFLGMYTFLGSWVAWERDAAKSAKDVAARWRESMERTIQEWETGCDGSCDCEVCEMTQEELTKLITGALEEMTITVNQTVNCGCCDGGSSTTTTTDETPPEGYDIPEVDPTEPEVYVNDADKCDRATYLMVQYRNACLTAIQGLEGDFTAFGEWADDVVGWILENAGLTFSYDVYMSLREWMSLGAFTNTDDLISAYDPNFDSMVCGIVSSDTPSQAKASVRGILESFVWSEVSPYARLAYKKIFELLPFDLVFDYDAVAVLPPGYIGRTCCGGEMPTPYNPIIPSDGSVVLLKLEYDTEYYAEDENWSYEIFKRVINDGYGIKYSGYTKRSNYESHGWGKLSAMLPSTAFLNSEYSTWDYIGMVVDNTDELICDPPYSSRIVDHYASESGSTEWLEEKYIYARQGSVNLAAFLNDNPELTVRYCDNNLYTLSAQPRAEWIVYSPNDAQYTPITYTHKIRAAYAVFKVT